MTTSTATAPPEPPLRLLEPAQAAPSIALLLSGVALPAAAVAIEAATRMCAGSFFDPIPTPAHAILAAAAPALNLFAWWRLRSGAPEIRSLATLLGASIGVSLIYALMFLPLVPLAVVAIIVLGWGLLPLSPYAALFGSLRMLAILSPPERRYPIAGILISCFLFALVEAPAIITDRGLWLATSGDAVQRQRGLQMLRTWGSVEEIRERCYDNRGRGLKVISFVAGAEQVNPEEVRKVFYLLTGEVFDSAPSSRTNAWALETIEWDPDVGGATVGQRMRGLSMAASRIDGSIDANADLAYLEWTLQFQNTTSRLQEARAQLQLPPGAIVSRVTLWVDGEEREAAYGSKSQVREAYRSVVRASRDPLLVTASGRDRVLVQCFPVPPNGEMKIRVGVTAPLFERNRLILPSFIERNFRIADDSKHAIWIESRRELSAAGMTLSRDNGLFQLKGESAALPAIAVGQAAGDEFRARDPRRPGWVIGRLTLVDARPPRKVAVVVDASAGLASIKPEIEDAIDRLRHKAEVTVIAATHAAVPVDDLRNIRFEGGVDGVPALVAAHDAKPDAIVWIHGHQPYTIQPVIALQQHRERGNTIPMYLVEAQSGPNRVAEALTYSTRVPRTASLAADLRALFTRWNGGWRWQFDHVDDAPSDIAVASSHLVRLWAAAETQRLIDARKPDEAGALAAGYQIVTPVSGAVVLENRRQYEQHHLTPADANSVPGVPEPATWALMAAGLSLLLIVNARRSRCNG